MRLEEILDGAGGSVLNVNFSLRQTFEQFIRRQIDKDKFVCPIEYRVGYGLPDPDFRDFLDNVVQPFEMLNVQGRPDIDPGIEQFVDVLPAFRVPAAGNIGVSVFVNQQKSRTAGQCRVEVELLNDLIVINDGLAWQNLETGDEYLGLVASVGLDQADCDIAAFIPRVARRGQHGIGLSDPGSGAQKYLQAAADFLVGHRQQGIGRSTLSRSLILRGRHAGPLPAILRPNCIECEI